jgi:CRP-like cAMP-binding protein
MTVDIYYDEEDIEEFLELTRAADQQEDTMTLRKLLSVQDKISIIANIDPDDLKAITYDLKFIKYSYKDIVIEEGDVSQEIFFILSGECQVFVQNKQVGVIPAGKTFGESAAIFSTKRNATVACSSESATVLAFSIDNDNMEFCAPALATLYKNLASQINSKLEEMNNSATKK